MTWWIVYDYGYLLEPYKAYSTKQEAYDNLMKARRCRPNAKVRVVCT